VGGVSYSIEINGKKRSRFARKTECGKEAQSALKAIVSSILTKNNATINPPRVPILPVPAIMGSIQQSTQESDENFPIDLNSLSYLSTLYSNKD